MKALKFYREYDAVKRNNRNDYYVLLRLIHHKTVEECHILYTKLSRFTLKLGFLGVIVFC